MLSEMFDGSVMFGFVGDDAVAILTYGDTRVTAALTDDEFEPLRLPLVTLIDAVNARIAQAIEAREAADRARFN